MRYVPRRSSTPLPTIPSLCLLHEAYAHTSTAITTRKSNITQCTARQAGYKLSGLLAVTVLMTVHRALSFKSPQRWPQDFNCSPLGFPECLFQRRRQDDRLISNSDKTLWSKLMLSMSPEALLTFQRMSNRTMCTSISTTYPAVQITREGGSRYLGR